jgi:hypothetical protein
MITHWYDPVTGLIVKSERVEIEARGRDKATGSGTTASRKAQQIRSSTGFCCVGRGQVFKPGIEFSALKKNNFQPVPAPPGNKIRPLIEGQTNPAAPQQSRRRHSIRELRCVRDQHGRV